MSSLYITSALLAVVAVKTSMLAVLTSVVLIIVKLSVFLELILSYHLVRSLGGVPFIMSSTFTEL